MGKLVGQQGTTPKNRCINTLNKLFKSNLSSGNSFKTESIIDTTQVQKINSEILRFKQANENYVCTYVN